MNECISGMFLFICNMLMWISVMFPKVFNNVTPETEFPSAREHYGVESLVEPFLRSKAEPLELNKEKHIEFCIDAMYAVHHSRNAIAFMQPWILYWNLHAVDLLKGISFAFGDTIDFSRNLSGSFNSTHIIQKTADTLRKCAESYPQNVSRLISSSTQLTSEEIFVRAGLNYLAHTSKDGLLEMLCLRCPCCGFQIDCQNFDIVDFCTSTVVKSHRAFAPGCTVMCAILPHRGEVVDHLSTCFTTEIMCNTEGNIVESGGYCGAAGQIPHLASTYAAVNTLMIIGGTNFSHAYDSIPRDAIARWIRKLYNKQDGSYSMHIDGEADIRATYCALSVATLLNLDIQQPVQKDSPLKSTKIKSSEKLLDFIKKCQTYEGGFSCQPLGEAHGGYTFCALACFSILDAWHDLDLCNLKKWVAQRQSETLGAFNGRTNKLVDACYSFWIGGTDSLITASESIISTEAPRSKYHNACDNFALKQWLHKVTPTSVECPLHDFLLDSASGIDFRSLVFFVSNASQNITSGGFRDKPSIEADSYHTCYALSGIAIAQRFVANTGFRLHDINPIFNLCHDRVTSALLQFRGKGYF